MKRVRWYTTVSSCRVQSSRQERWWSIHIVAENVVVGKCSRWADRPENIEDKANWGVTVIAKGIHIGKNAKVPAKAMIEKDVPEVSGDVE